MANTPEWKKVLQEPHALGWIGFFILVVLIGFWALHSDFGDPRSPAPKASAAHATR